MNKLLSRQRRARKTRIKIAELKMLRLSVHRTNMNIYAQITDSKNGAVIVSASTLEKEMRDALGKNRGDIKSASLIGKRIAEKAEKKGIAKVAFDRSGYKYHGRVKALAESAREGGLSF